MRLIKKIIILCCLFVISCELHEPLIDNSLDLESAAEKGIFPPALVFHPSRVETTVGGTVGVNVYAMKLEKVGMAQIEVNYDSNKLSVKSVTQGSLFEGGNSPFFIFEDDSSNGVLTIYITYLGPGGNSVSGTGDIALISFNARSMGQTEFSINQESIILDPDAKSIPLNGYGKGMIDAQ